MAKFPAPAEGIVLTHFIVASDVGQSRRYYADVLDGEVLRDGEPSIVALANSWIIINAGGPPTDDKPTVTLEPPRNPDHVSSFLNIRVADIHAARGSPDSPKGSARRSLRHGAAHQVRWTVRADIGVRADSGEADGGCRGADRRARLGAGDHPGGRPSAPGCRTARSAATSAASRNC